MKKLFKEFAEFINKGNALAMAIGVIIGGAFSQIVSTINQQIISPIVGLVLGGYNLSESEVLKTVLKPAILDEAGNIIQAENAIYWGSLIQTVIDFLLTAIVLFTIFKLVTWAIEHAKRNAEKLRELLSNEEKEVKVEETVVVEEAPVIEEVKPSDEVLLLTEIRDLLSKKNLEDKE